MIASQNVFDTLKSIGLNLYERKLWVALLSRGTSTAGELSTLAKVPRSRTYDVLESLAEKGFVIVQTAKPLKYVAVAPKEALERAKQKIKEKTEVMTNRIDSLKNSAVIKELDKICKEGFDLVESADLSGSLKGRPAMHQQLDTVFKSAKKRISIVATPQTLKEIHSNHSNTLKKAASKGVKVRIASPTSSQMSDVVKAMKTFAEIRKADAKAGRFCVVDGKHMILALTEDKTHPTQDLSFWTQSEHAANTLEPMFDHMWKRLKAV